MFLFGVGCGVGGAGRGGVVSGAGDEVGGGAEEGLICGSAGESEEADSSGLKA